MELLALAEQTSIDAWLKRIVQLPGKHCLLLALQDRSLSRLSTLLLVPRPPFGAGCLWMATVPRQQKAGKEGEALVCCGVHFTEHGNKKLFWDVQKTWDLGT